jgi:hypothetical protein
MTLRRQSVVFSGILIRLKRVVFPLKSLSSFNFSQLIYGGLQMIEANPSKGNLRIASLLFVVSFD